jgi:hypothetical protein
METKVCSKCGQEKPKDDFYKNRMCSDGYRNFCKECCKQKQKEYRLENSDSIINKKREDYYNNREVILEKKQQQYYQDPYNDPKEVEKRKNERHEMAIENQKEYQKKYRKDRRINDPVFRLKYNIRRRINDFIKQRTKRTSELLGCSWEELKNHIETQFVDGMSWDNYGVSGWHLDHIIPLSTAKTEDELYQLNHYTNLQPLWWRDNILKGDKLPYEWINEYEDTSN